MGMIDWGSGSDDLEAKIAELKGRVVQLETAIRKHRDARGHDRCFENNEDLYKLLPDYKGPTDPKLPPKPEFLAGCDRYYDEESRKRG